MDPLSWPNALFLIHFYSVSYSFTLSIAKKFSLINFPTTGNGSAQLAKCFFFSSIFTLFVCSFTLSLVKKVFIL